MVIHGLGYRPLQYEPTPAWRRLLPLAKLEFLALFRRRFSQALFFGCLAPSIASLVILLARIGVWQLGELRQGQIFGGGSPRLDPAALRFYLDPILFESYIPILILTSLVSSRAIAKDRAAGALELLWTRGITPAQYFVGKWSGSLLLLLVPCVACPLTLWLFAAISAPDWGLLQQTIEFMPRAVVALAFFAASISLIAVLFSALAANPNAATLFWLTLIVGTSVLGRLLGRVFRGEDWWRAINPFDATIRIARWIAGEEGRAGWTWSPAGAALALGAMLAALALLAAKRLRLAEALP